MTVPLAIALAELRSPLEQSYRNSVYCAESLEQNEDGRIRGLFCGNRWCLVCNRVRTARAINNYFSTMRAWPGPQFVTLTLPNVCGEELADTIGAMLKDISSLGRAIRRTDCLRFRALRKLECTYNPEQGTFHPHFHIVIEGKAAAEALRRRWLTRHPEASPKAQDVRQCDERSMLEMFKYFTKLLTRRSDNRGSSAIAPIEALNEIFQAMRGRRVYQPMGFTITVPPTQDEDATIGTSGDTIATKRLGEQVHWDWMQDLHDWIDLSSGEVLTGYAPTEEYRTILRSIQIRH